eukprot:NODE_3839_length_725_cov_37.991124_g3237_i0.p1 GENE.NODE_3839_length_725_cov_37.991124_g3237_i0~~NODE_3839_length_725_cov_37.991124_g3237_i0.p1  ORF type:complete len:220 (+),score=40.88 NODE_3839_length_725_cov_37.991124_g3237_i0:41-700(+)
MPYKIRNKGFQNFTPGLTPRLHPAKKTKTNMDLTTTVTLQTHITRFTGLRILHNYRNISRSTKQFLMGDKVLEQLMILTIKEHYFAPMYYQTPIENTFYLGRALADLTDRHYALFANNQHPVQLATYEQYNKFLRSVHDEDDRAQDKAVKDRFNEVVEERNQLLNAKEGESLSIDDLSDIYMQVMGEFRNKQNFSLQTKSKNGEISDYLEVRRPFGANQ